MIKMSDNFEIGKYLESLILKKYDSKRSFYKEYVKLKYHVSENDNQFEDYLKGETNRFNQIVHGNKGVQTHDLPIIAHILNVTFEEILSAGKSVIDVMNVLDSEVELEQWKHPLCYECGYKFAWLNEETCPHCGTMNPQYEKEFIEKKYHEMSEEEFDKLDEELSNDELETKMVRYLYQLHKKAKEDMYECYELAYVHSNKRYFVFYDIDKAIYWAKKGAEFGDTRCNMLLADLYNDGEGVIKDVGKAIYWLERATDDLDCYYRLAHILCFTDTKHKNLDRGIAMLKELELIVDGSKYEDAIEDLGILYYEEFGEYKKAFEYLSKLQKTKYCSDVNYYLGECYFRGRGVEQNFDKAVWYYQKGWDPSVKSILRMATCYLEGKGVEVNKDKAMELYDDVIKYYEERGENKNASHVKRLKTVAGGNK